MFDLQFRLIHDPPHPAAQAYWITHAGGGTNTLAHRLRTIEEEIPIRVQTPRMPAREDLSDVLYEDDLNTMARLIAGQIESQRSADPVNRDLPFALIGHSFGSVLAYRVACELVSRGIIPQRLVVMSFPSLSDLSYERALHTLDDEMLVQEVDELFGGIPNEVRQDETALKFFVPGLRVDLGLLEGYRHEAGFQLPIPIVAICGTDDKAVNVEEMNHWREQTTGSFRLRSMPGDHFFPLERMPEILQVAFWDVLPG